MPDSFKIAFIDLKTYKLIKIVEMESDWVFCTAVSEMDENGNGPFFYYFGYDFELFKFDLEKVFNSNTNEIPKYIWKAPTPVYCNRDIKNNVTMSIVKLKNKKFTIMLSSGYVVEYYSNKDGSIIEMETYFPEEVNAIQSSDGSMERDTIIILKGIVLGRGELFQSYS